MHWLVGFVPHADERPCLLLVARKRGLRATTIDLRNSGDTVGGHDEVVGYGAFVID